MARDQGPTVEELKKYRDELRASYEARGIDMTDPGIRFVLGEIDEPTLRASLEIPDDWEPADHIDGDEAGWPLAGSARSNCCQVECHHGGQDES